MSLHSGLFLDNFDRLAVYRKPFTYSYSNIAVKVVIKCYVFFSKLVSDWNVCLLEKKTIQNILMKRPDINHRSVK